MITVYSLALLIVISIGVGADLARGSSASLVGYILALPVFLRAIGWL